MATVTSPILTDATFATKMDALAAAVKPDASDIPLTPPSGMTATNVQDGFSEIKQSLSDLENLEKSASGSVVTFSDGSDLPLAKLEVAIKLVQTGSGVPSPTNVRTISGWTDCNVTVADDLDDPNVQNVYTIALGGTRYEGALNVLTGELTVTDIEIDMSAKTINKYADGQFYFVDYTDFIDFNNTNPTATCEIYQDISYSQWINKGVSNGICGINSSHVVYILDDRFTSDTDLHNALNGYKLIVKLTTPQTYTLTPTQVHSLLGVNNIYADTGDLELTYFVNNSLVQAIYDMVNILNS